MRVSESTESLLTLLNPNWSSNLEDIWLRIYLFPAISKLFAKEDREGEREEREPDGERASACVTPIKELTLAESSATQFHLFDKASFGVI